MSQEILKPKLNHDQRRVAASKEKHAKARKKDKRQKFAKIKYADRSEWVKTVINGATIMRPPS